MSVRAFIFFAVVVLPLRAQADEPSLKDVVDFQPRTRSILRASE